MPRFTLQASLKSYTRHASTSATTSPLPGSAGAAQSSQQHAQPLDWQAFFKLRQSRRRFSLTASIFATAVTVSTFASLVVNTPLSDTITSYSPFPDPFITLIVCAMACAASGWLIGPFFGQGIWRILNKSQIRGFLAKEKDFYERVIRYRVDPRGGSAQNPVPDFYGERVGSRDQWRTWLKDQRAFNRKREGRGTGMGGGLGYKGKGASE